MMTRQQRYQIRQRKAGKCITCGGKLDKNSVVRCTIHLVKRRLKQQAYWDRLKPRNRRRRRKAA